MQGVQELSKATAVYVGVSRDLGTAIDSALLRHQLPLLTYFHIHVSYQVETRGLKLALTLTDTGCPTNPNPYRTNAILRRRHFANRRRHQLIGLSPACK